MAKYLLLFYSRVKPKFLAMKLFLQTSLATIFSFSISLHTEAQKLAVIPYVSGITSPIDIKNCGDDRLFIADRTGLIRVIDADGSLRSTPFLDITSKISSTTSEEGLLGIVFSPNYKSDGKFYVDYTSNIESQLTTVVEEYTVSSADSNVADVSSALPILTQSQPTSIHKGGNLMFGKDGYLYINFGDGGSEGDPNGNAQNKATFLGKILRIDVSNSTIGQPYVIPSSNPFYSDATPGIKKEIWIYGVRNPWRSSVDRLTGDIFIADVGQDKIEEVNFQKVNDAGGENYGWNIVEGDSCYNPSSGCDKTGITVPIYEYFHNGSSAAVTGGYVYRSASSKSLWGQYIFGDYILQFIDAFSLDNGTVSGNVHELISPAEATGNPISFGEDRDGDQYVVFYGDGTIYKLEDTSYLRRPKAYFTPINQGGNSYLFQGLQGKNITYQWLNNNVVIPDATSADYITSGDGNYSLVTTNDLGFSDTSNTFALGSLPLNLISFTAQKTPSGKTLLQWKTASEQNIAGYTVLRRQNNQPDFSNIGFVNSKSINGSSGSELDYGFTDSFPLNNAKLFYRLQIENVDGSYTFSPIRTITPGISRISYSIYPNPAKAQAIVYVPDLNRAVLMNIYNSAGQKVKEQLLNQETTTINLAGLKGVYIVQLSNTDGSSLVRKKLVVQ